MTRLKLALSMTPNRIAVNLQADEKGHPGNRQPTTIPRKWAKRLRKKKYEGDYEPIVMSNTGSMSYAIYFE